MMRTWVSLALLLAASWATGAERKFEFGECREGETPAGVRSSVTGRGKPGQWRIVVEDTPSLLPPLTPRPAARTTHSVLAQIATDPDDEHFPLLIYENEKFGDFTLRT